MKNIAILITAIMFFMLGATVDSDAQKSSPGKTSHYIRDILGGDTFEKELLQDHPGGQLIWKEQIVEDAEDRFTCLVYSEFNQPGEEPRYYFYEVKVRFIPPSEMFQDPTNN